MKFGYLIYLLFCACVSRAQLSVLPGENGKVTLSVNGNVWLESQDTRLAAHSFASGDLVVVNTSTTTASDVLGDYVATSWSWGLKEGLAPAALPGDCAVVMTTSARVYASKNKAVFRQEFPCGVNLTGSANNDPRTQWVATEFPAFKVVSTATFARCALFNGPFAQKIVSADVGVGSAANLTKCAITVQGGVPFVLHESAGPRVGASVVFSQLTRFKTGEMYAGDRASLGLKGTLAAIPAGFAAEWIASFCGSGMLEALEQWGDALLRNSGKERWGVYDDAIASGMGWWTDNGAYYHYGGVQPPPNNPGAYQAAMHAAHAAHQAQKLPFQHWQLDSWWYPKGNGSVGSSWTHKGELAGVYRWTADPWVFPDGVGALQKAVGLPFVQHNRWLAPGNWYRYNSSFGGAWTKSGDVMTLPLDMEGYWRYFFEEVGEYGEGLATYEQDFLYTQYEGVLDLRTNATLADDWLDEMAIQARAKNLTMQYCMPYPREYLVSTKHPNVVTIRASHDYHAGNTNWIISRTSLLAHAVGLLPFKDTFITSDNPEPLPSADPDLEPNTELQNIVATLSGAMVAPGDGPTLTNRTRLMRCCNESGLILKPDRPAVAIDAQWTESAPGGEVSWAPVTGAAGTAFVVLAAQVKTSYGLTPADLGAAGATNLVAYSWKDRAMATRNNGSCSVSAANPLELKRNIAHSPNKAVAWDLYTIAPVIDGWAVIGDPNKYVTSASKRIVAVSRPGDARVVVTVAAEAGEALEICAFEAASEKLVCQTGTAGTDGTLAVEF